jgi:hypothetical protein
VARGFTNTFVGISPKDIGPFLMAEIAAIVVYMLMFCSPKK